MTEAKFDIEKFDGTGDFGLWRIKMRALLIQHGCEAALEVLPADMEAQTKTELNKKAHSAVILCLGNKVLREVIGETTAAGVWSKLETLYMTKSLANKLYLKKKLYTFCMSAGRKISEHIDEFNKIVLDLANIEVKFEDEDLALLLLTFLPASYEHFVDTLLYGREALTLEDVMTILNSKKIKERSKAKGDDGEGLYVRGRTDRRDSRQSRGNSRSKSRGGRLKCYICQSEDHLKRNCPKNNRKKSTGYAQKDEQPSSSGSTYDDYEVMMVMSAQAQALLDWILHSGCSYYMTPRLDILFDFIECDGGRVQLGDNRECKIKGIGKMRVQLKDGSSFVLHNVRYIPELKRNLISLGTLEKEGYTVKMQSGKVKVSLMLVLKKKTILCRFGTKDWDISARRDYRCWKSRGCLAYGVHLRFKHKAFGKFKEWKQLVENQTGRTVKKLRTDNGLEFYNREFEQLCIESGIARHLIVAEKPQQNGVAECMNRTLMDKVEVELQRLNNHTPEEDQKDQEDGDDKDEGDQETDQPPDLTDYQLVQDREPRTRTKPLRFRDESNMAAYPFVAAEEEDTHEPLTYYEAVACEDSSKWKLFKIKEGIDCVQKPRYKARFVARGFTQRAGIDYNEVSSPVVRHTSIRVILALTACKDYELEHLDVKTAFLHGNLEEVIYMKQPPGYEQDDMLIACKSKAEIESTNSFLKKEFDMKELGKAKNILGIKIVKDRSRNILKVSQSGDCDVERMGKVPYANAVMSLMYLMVCTSPDIAYAATLQHVMTLSTIEAEYMALTEVVNEAIWLRGLLKELGVLEGKTVKVLKVGTEHNAADALTKVVPGLKLQHCLEWLSVSVG
ncbi:retrotransposon protein, putative, ty1-copia subclass [Tanacetum coccineum]